MVNIKKYVMIENSLIDNDLNNLFQKRKEKLLAMRLALKDEDFESYENHKKEAHMINDQIKHLGLRIRNVQNM